MVDESGILVMWVHGVSEGRERVYEWKVMNRSREGLEWDVRKWDRQNNERCGTE